jgi:hypothetical protein
VRDVAPDTLLPFVGDIHLDHQLTFLSAMVAARPYAAEFPGRILCYETLSETNWNARSWHRASCKTCSSTSQRSSNTSWKS